MFRKLVRALKVTGCEKIDPSNIPKNGNLRLLVQVHVQVGNLNLSNDHIYSL